MFPRNTTKDHAWARSKRLSAEYRHSSFHSTQSVRFGPCARAADCFAELLEFAAFVKLRISHRDLYRPYEIPLGTVGVCILLLPAAVFVALLAVFSSALTWGVSLIAVLIGWGLYPCLEIAKRRRWCEFRPVTLYDGDATGTDHGMPYGDLT